MKERPILFSAPMVRAILAGAKTVTRRVCKPMQRWVDQECREVRHLDGIPHHFMKGAELPIERLRSPYGVAGDRLWVREAWRTSVKLDARNGTEIAKECLDAGYHRPWAPIEYGADGARHDWNGLDWGEPGRARSARFMPRWASRLTLDVVSVRVERVQEITESDAYAEGVESLAPKEHYETARDHFRALWDSINAARGFGWDANPWVFRVEFRRVAS